MLLAPIVEIFCDIDDFCKDYSVNESLNKRLTSPKKTRCRPTALCESELMTIVVLFHLSHYRTFKDYYQSCVRHDRAPLFPNLLSYNRFVELIGRILPQLTAYVLSKSGEKTRLYYIDSTKLVVCHNKRISGHRVFRGLAQPGYSSVGYFFGFKLHLAINHHGEIVSFCLTRGNESDLNVLAKLAANLTGLMAGDKGYVSQKHEQALDNQGLKLITKLKKNMKKKARTAFEKAFLAGRNLIGTVIEQLKAVCQIEHSRHRSPLNFLVNLISGLAAYALKPNKPSIKVDILASNMTKLIPNSR